MIQKFDTFNVASIDSGVNESDASDKKFIKDSSWFLTVMKRLTYGLEKSFESKNVEATKSLMKEIKTNADHLFDSFKI